MSTRGHTTRPDIVLHACKSGLQQVNRNRLMSVFSVATSAVMLLMLGSFLVMVASLNVTLRALEQKVNVVAYLKDGADPAAVQNLHDSLLKDARVASVTLITKQQALVRMQQTLGSQSKLLAQLGDNPLPASFEIALKSAGSAPQIAQLVQSDPAVESVDYQQGVVDRLLAITGFLRLAGLGLVVGLAIIALFIIINTTRIAVYGRRQEIEIMKLVGATDWFVRGPFLFEGMALGFMGAVVSCCLLAASYRPIIAKIASLLTFLPLDFDPLLLPKLLGVVLGGGLAVGAAGSYISVRRFLDV